MTYTLYSMQTSGNCYKPRLLMHQLGIPFRLVETDSVDGRDAHAGIPGAQPQRQGAAARSARRPQAFRIRTPCCSISPRARTYLPADRYERALVNQWLFFEQYDHEPTIAVARSLADDLSGPHRQGDAGADSPSWQKRGNSALGVMEKALAGQRLARRRRLFGRRHRALRLHPRRRRRRLRPRRLSRHRRLAEARRRRAPPRRPRLAAGGVALAFAVPRT